MNADHHPNQDNLFERLDFFVGEARAVMDLHLLGKGGFT
jgi:hypothetical protein